MVIFKYFPLTTSALGVQGQCKSMVFKGLVSYENSMTWSLGWIYRMLPPSIGPFPFRSMVVELVPLTGGIGSIVHPPIGRKNTTYIPLIVLAEPGGGPICYRSHLLGEPETTIDIPIYMLPTTSYHLLWE